MMIFKGEKRKQGPGWLECMGTAEDRNDRETGIKSRLFCSDGIKTLMTKITCLSQRNT